MEKARDNMTLVKLLGFAVGAALIAMSASPVYAAGSETVNCSAPGTQLQKKLDSAQEDSIVFVTGTCDDGPFNINRDIILFGLGGATLSAVDGSGSVLTVNWARAIIAGITIDGDGETIGIIVRGGQARLFNVVVEGAVNGIFVSAGGSVTTDNVQSSNNEGVGIIISGSSGANLFNSKFEQNRIGVLVQLSSSATINGDSTFEGNGNGIIISTNGSVSLSDSTIKNSTFHGVYVLTQGVLSAFGSPIIFENNGGIDVKCESRGIVETGASQIPNGGSTMIDPSCLVFGTIFLP